ncbi:MAG TPA: lytic transglycosylase domain-containing protein [Rhodocyclaceae bacterium]
MPGSSSPPSMSCLVREADRNGVDPYVLLAVMKTEGGRPGELALNRNGTIDLGPMSVNTAWLPSLARHYRVAEPELKRRLALDGCANVAAGALILGRKISESGNVWEGVANYHSGNPARQGRYLMRVYASLSRIVARLKATSPDFGR